MSVSVSVRRRVFPIVNGFSNMSSKKVFPNGNGFSTRPLLPSDAAVLVTPLVPVPGSSRRPSMVFPMAYHYGLSNASFMVFPIQYSQVLC